MQMRACMHDCTLTRSRVRAHLEMPAAAQTHTLAYLSQHLSCCRAANSPCVRPPSQRRARRDSAAGAAGTHSARCRRPPAACIANTRLAAAGVTANTRGHRMLITCAGGCDCGADDVPPQAVTAVPRAQCPRPGALSMHADAAVCMHRAMMPRRQRPCLNPGKRCGTTAPRQPAPDAPWPLC